MKHKEYSREVNDEVHGFTHKFMRTPTMMRFTFHITYSVNALNVDVRKYMYIIPAIMRRSYILVNGSRIMNGIKNVWFLTGIVTEIRSIHIYFKISI